MLRDRRYESQEAMLKNRRYDLRRQFVSGSSDQSRSCQVLPDPIPGTDRPCMTPSGPITSKCGTTRPCPALSVVVRPGLAMPSPARHCLTLPGSARPL